VSGGILRDVLSPIRIPGDLVLPDRELVEHIYGSLDDRQRDMFWQQLVRAIWESQSANDLRPLRNTVLAWLAEGRLHMSGTLTDLERRAREAELEDPISIDEIQRLYGT
jgi:hypothetical protein